MRYYRITLFAACYFAVLTIVSGQDYENLRFGQITTEDGLSHNTVNDIVDDQYGFLWIATMDGLNRYDGRQFEVFSNDPKDSTSLVNNTIWALHKDKLGQIWIGTQNGLCRYSYTSNSFHRIKLSSIEEPPTIRHIKEDSYGNIWISLLSGGTVKLTRNPENNSYEETYIPRLIKTSATNTVISQDSIDKNTVWYYSGSGFLSLDLHTNQLNQLSELLPKNDIHEDIITSMLTDSNGDIWIGSNIKGLYQIDRSNNIIYSYQHDPQKEQSIISNSAFDIIEDKNKHLWISSFENGLSITKIGNEENKFITYEAERTDPYSLKSNTLSKIHQDNNGIIWIGTHGSGLHFYDQSFAPFNLHRKNDNDPVSIPSNNITSIFEDRNGYTWVGTRGEGVSKIKLTESGKRIESIETYVHDQNDPFSINNNTTNSYLEHRRFGLLLGQRLGGINVYDAATNKFRDYLISPGDLDQLRNYHVNKMQARENGDIWIASATGIFLWEDEKNQLINYNDKYSELNQFSDKYLWFVKEVNGQLWISATELGLSRWDLQTETLTQYGSSQKKKDALPIDQFLSIHNDGNDLWLGSWEQGLFKLNRTTGEVKNYNKTDGLQSSAIYSIQEDSLSLLWLSTNRGIAKLNKETEQIYNYDVSDGLQGEEYNSFAGFTSKKNGRIYFGGMTGLNTFQPSQIIDENARPDVHIAELLEFKKGETEEHVHKISYEKPLEKITITHETYLLQFKIAAPLLPVSKDVEFSYKIEGLGNAWIDLNHRQEFSLTNLTKGTYKILIRAGAHGVWNESPFALSIIALAPWWQRWWAYLLYFSFVGLALYTFYKSRISRLIKYQNLRTQISSDLHDDVGTILSAMAFQTEMLELDHKSANKEKFKKITDMSRLALGRMRDTVWAIDAGKDNVESLINRMSDFLFDVFEDQKITYLFSKEIDKEQAQLAPDIRQAIYLVFKESVTNALKHTNGSQIEIIINLNNKGFFLEVSDNGLIDPASIKTSGLGLNNMKNRAAKIGADFSYDISDGFKITMSREG